MLTYLDHAMRYTRLPATALPVNLDELLVHMRTGFDAGSADPVTVSESQRLAFAATREVEDYCGIALMRQVISLTLSAEGGDTVDLPIGPLAPDAHVTVNGIETADGIEGGRWPRITLPANVTGTVVLTYEAGYGDTPASIPADLGLAVMDQASMLYDARGPTDVRQGLSVAAARICARHRRVRL